MRVRFADVNGFKTRILSSGGNGAPLLLLHGIGLSADIWSPTLRGLGSDFTVYAPDILWHGFTEGPALPPSRAPHPVLLDHLEGIADLLEFDRFSVIGSSFGALLGALFYLRLPERVSKLVIVGSGSCFDSEDSLIDMLAKAYENALRAMTLATWDAWRVRLENICLDPAAVTGEIIPLLATAYAQPGATSRFQKFMEARQDMELERPHRIIDRLDQMALPTLVVWGRQEVRGDLEAARKAVQELPDGQLVVYEHCGHLPFLERATRFNEDMRDFLGDGRARSY